MFGVKAELVSRNNYTFTFTNAQPGSDVGFSAKVYPDASSTVEDGPMLVLDSSNAVSVWSDATILTAHTVDGTGNTLVATATVSSTSVTADSGTAGQSPFGGGGGASGQSGDYVFLTADNGSIDDQANTVLAWSVGANNGTTITVDGDDPTKIDFASDGLYQMFVRVAPSTSADGQSAVLTLNDAADGVWDAGFFANDGDDYWVDMTSNRGGLLTLPPFPVSAGDWLQWQLKSISTDNVVGQVTAWLVQIA